MMKGAISVAVGQQILKEDDRSSIYPYVFIHNVSIHGFEWNDEYTIW